MFPSDHQAFLISLEDLKYKFIFTTKYLVFEVSGKNFQTTDIFKMHRVAVMQRRELNKNEAPIYSYWLCFKKYRDMNWLENVKNLCQQLEKSNSSKFGFLHSTWNPLIWIERYMPSERMRANGLIHISWFGVWKWGSGGIMVAFPRHNCK